MILARNIKNYSPTNFLVLIIAALLAWIKVFVSWNEPGIYISTAPMPLYNWIYDNIGGENFAFLCKFIAFFLVIFQMIMLNGIVNQRNLLGFRSYLPGFFYIVLIANFPAGQLLNPLLIANIFLLWAWDRVAHITETANAYTAFFNSAFLIGIASLVYPEASYFLLLIFMAISFNRISRPREFALAIFGFLAIWYIYLSFSYIFYELVEAPNIFKTFSFSYFNFSGIKVGQKIALGLFILLILMANLQLAGYISSYKIHIRRNFKLMLIWFVLGLMLLFLSKAVFLAVYILAVPISFLLANFFMNIRNRWMAEIILILTISISIINQFFPNLF